MMNKPLFWVLLFFAGRAMGQTYLMNGTPIAACTGTFYDSGGSTGDYNNNQNLSTTICPDNGMHMRLDFMPVDLAPGDELCFYDGSTVLAPLLACVSDFPAGQAFFVQASPSNPGGCLTLLFISDAAGTAPGWEAAISCVSDCLFPAPANVQVVYMMNGNMVWTWNDVPGSMGFEVSINGGNWQPANGNLSHTVTGLAPGALVVIEIRAINGIPGCISASITANKTYVNCQLDISAGPLLPALCPGAATGSATITATGAMGAVQFFADSSSTPYPTGNFTNFFAAGNHFVIARDAAGCLDTVSFLITEPPPIVISDSVTNAECFGDDSGKIQAHASGGTPSYTYAWQGCQGGPIVHDSIAIDLFAGCYAVTVTDKNGCTAILQDSIRQPDKFKFSSTQDSVKCFGGTDGQATVFVTGGFKPYKYKWDNGDTTQMAHNLKANFHSVTITDSVGCQAVTLVQVLEPTRLIVDSISLTAIACFGSATGSATANAHGGVKPYSYLWNVPGAGKTITGLGAGTYTVTISDKHGCTAIASTMLNAPPEIQLQISNLRAESCAGACNGEFVLDISGGNMPHTIAWNNPAIPPGTLMPKNLCPANYSATVTDSKGCTKTISATVKAAVPIQVQLNGNAPLCAGNSNGSIAAAANGGTAPLQYKWNTGQTGTMLTGLSCGIFTVTVTDSLGCTKTAFDTLACPAALLLDSIVPASVRCFGEANGRITAYANGGTGLLKYKWSDPNQQFDSIAVNLPKGTYTVTISDANGCSVTASATVTEPPLLSGMLASTPVTCFGGNDGTASVEVLGGVKPYMYAWSVPQITPVITGLTAGAYSVTVTDASGCPISDLSIQVLQPPGPVLVTTTQTQLACFGSDNGKAIAAASGSNGPPFSFQWSNGMSIPAPGNFAVGTYTVTATDAKGCTGTNSITVSQWDSIRVNVVLIPPSCSGTADGQAAVNLVAGGAGNGEFDNYHFVWNVPGMPDTIYLNGLTGNRTYKLTVTDSAGCSSEFIYFLSDQDSITFNLVADSVSCFGLSDGNISITNITSKDPISTYSWSNGGTGMMQNNLAAGAYSVTLTNTAGCTGAGTTNVFSPPLLTLKLDVTALVCNIDSNGVVRAVVQGGTMPYLYSWNTGSNAAQIDQLGPGNYQVSVSDKNGCTVTASADLTQPNPPEIKVEITAPTCYGGQDGLIHLIVSGGNPPYKYSLDGANYNGSSVFLGLGAGTYLAYVRDNTGCITTVQATVGQPPPVSVSLGPDQSITLGDSVLITADIFNTVGLASFSWRSALVDSLVCQDMPDCSAIQVYPSYNNTYFITITDANGCRAEDEVFVAVSKPRGVYVPTAFSPNGDASNDLLVVYGKSRQIRQVTIFQVYDRWGELVYEDRDFAPNNESRGWDGVFRGQDCQPGVYVWYVEVEYQDGYIEAKRGNTTLIR